MKLSNTVSGLFLVVLGAVATYGGSVQPPVPGQQVGPSVFPMVVGTGLMLCGALIAMGVGSAMEEEAEAEISTRDSDSAGDPTGNGIWSGMLALLPPALVYFYVLASERIGFIATAFVMILVAALAFGGKLKHALALAIVSPFLVHLVFYKLLRVPLPPGLIPTPW